jgi:large subunit ribosomal protein L24
MGKRRIKKGDMVLVVTGKDRDLSTPHRVLQISGSDRALVEGVNMVKRHTRPNPQKNIKGGILEKESPIHLSNLMPIDPESKRPTRVRIKVLDDGKRVRIAARSGAMLDK